MKYLFKTSIQQEVQERRARMDRLDEKVKEFSKALVQEEVKHQKSFIDTEYFLKISHPTFEHLPVPEQMMFLALWYCERNRSIADNKFSIECQKRVDGINVDFLVSLNAGKNNYQAAVECEIREDKRQRLEELGLPVLNYTKRDLWARPLEVADEVFTYLDSQAERALLQ